MKTKEKKGKAFDAVKMMRKIRDKISSETSEMSYEEFKTYLNKRLKQEPKSNDSK
jgi:hypothetical protein